MASEHVQVVQRAVKAVQQGDPEALIALCTEDVVLLPGRSVLMGGYHGPAGVRKFFSDNAEMYAHFSVSSDETFDAGDQVVAIGRVIVRPLRGAPEATAASAFVFTFEGGKIARAEDFRERSAALESVGLDA